jgi:hypothetical protein
MGNKSNSPETNDKNKIILPNIDDIDFSNNHITDELKENLISNTIKSLEKKDIELNHYINSTELRLPSYFTDQSYDKPKNK